MIAERVPVGKPVLGEEGVGIVARVMASGWITRGAEVAAFESEFAALGQAPYACAVLSCWTYRASRLRTSECRRARAGGAWSCDSSATLVRRV